MHYKKISSTYVVLAGRNRIIINWKNLNHFDNKNKHSFTNFLPHSLIKEKE